MKLVIGNSISTLSGYTPKQFIELRELLSYTLDPQASYFSGNYRSKRSLFGKRGEFPTGLLYLVEKWLLKYEVHVVDTRVKPKPIVDYIHMEGIELD